MFTGLVRERGRIVESGPSDGGGVRLVIEMSSALAGSLEVGASLAVAGTCLTLTDLGERTGTVELSPETLARTTLGGAATGSLVNLEPALRAGEPLGGHWVQGHVDATLSVLDRVEQGEHAVVRFGLPAGSSRYVVEKGSVTLDGVSLTVSARGDEWFEVALIPHTLEVTTLDALRPGQRVNFEVDILAKYVERALLEAGRLAP